MPHYSLFAFSADKWQYKETVRLELMHFLPLLGAGKVGEVGRDENIQPTGQQCTEVSPASDYIPGFPCDSFCPAKLHKERILS